MSSPEAIATDWLEQFSTALASAEPSKVADCFEERGFWRDFVSFTWNLYTAEGRQEIEDMASHTATNAQAHHFRLTETPEIDADGVITAWLAFDTVSTRGMGILRIREGLAWTLLTTADALHGFEEAAGPHRPQGVEHNIYRGRHTWLENRHNRQAIMGHSEQPYTLVIGGGQGGIGLAARLQTIGVPTLVIDRNSAAGDAWRNRYKSLHLHDPVWYDHMPYLNFPETWPVFPSKDKIADWLKYYTEVMELNYWPHTVCTHAQWNEQAEAWKVTVERDGETITLMPTHVVFALGVSGYPHIPPFDGQERFTGSQHHSSEHDGGDHYAGQRAVVIGSNNSAHDICASLWEHGADVTMVQRSSTHVVRSESLMDVVLKPLYSEQALAQGIDTYRADRLFASWPYRLLPDVQRALFQEIRDRDADYYDALEGAGFDLDFGEDDSGLFLKYLRRGSGYYIDVGASQLIIDGSIRLAHGQVASLTEDAVVLEDGTELPADVVVYATGFGSMNEWLRDIISPTVAAHVGKCWGFGSDTTRDPGPWEGELRNMWKPTHVKNLWFHGGNLHQSRHFSTYLALQLKARYEGIETPVYGLQPSHHAA